MGTFLGLLGILIGALLIKYRERVGDMIGEADWMNKVGGVYIFVTILGVFIIFWSIAELTDTTGIFFAPLKFLIPGLRNAAPSPEIP